MSVRGLEEMARREEGGVSASEGETHKVTTGNTHGARIHRRRYGVSIHGYTHVRTYQGQT